MRAFEYQAAKIAVGAHVVEAVIVHTGVGHVRRHALDGVSPSDFEESAVTGRVELKDHRAKLKALRPLGPTLGSVPTVSRKNR